MSQFGDIPIGENSQGDKNLIPGVLIPLCHILKSLSISLNKFGLKKRLSLKKISLEKVLVGVSKNLVEKKSRYRSRKNLVSKKSRYRSRKHLVSKKSLSIGLENIW